MRHVYSLAERPEDVGYWGKQVDDFMRSASQLPPDQEYSILLYYLAEYSPICEHVKNVACETWIDQYAYIAKDAYRGRARIIERLSELYVEKGGAT